MNTPPLDEAELRALCTCSACGRKIGQTAIPILWKVSLERHGLNLPAIQRQQGLGQMLGGNARLAMVMGSGEPMTIPLMDRVTVMVCDECACAVNTLPLMALAEKSEQKTEGDEQ